MNRKYLEVFENLREPINENISKMADFDIFRNNQM